VTIPSCATWNQTGLTVAGSANGIAGTHLAGLDTPVSVFIDDNYTLFIADRENHRIVKYYANATVGVLVVGNLTAGNSSSQLNQPKAVVVGDSGAVIVADSSNFRIQHFLHGSTVATTFVTDSVATPLGQIRDMRIDVNNVLYISDSTYNRVLRFHPGNSTPTTVAGGNGLGSAANQLADPYGMFADNNQTLYIADKDNHRIQKYPPGAIAGITVAGVTGTTDSNSMRLSTPMAVVVDNNG
jgi:sugar lactone lactonase YvrE